MSTSSTNEWENHRTVSKIFLQERLEWICIILLQQFIISYNDFMNEMKRIKAQAGHQWSNDLWFLRRHWKRNHCSSTDDKTAVRQGITIGNLCQGLQYCAKKNLVQSQGQHLWTQRHLGWIITKWIWYLVFIFFGRIGNYVLWTKYKKDNSDCLPAASPISGLCDGFVVASVSLAKDIYTFVKAALTQKSARRY